MSCSRDEASETGFDTAVLVDARELVQLAARVGPQCFRFDVEIGLLGVALRAHRDVLADRHRQRAGHDRGDAGDDHVVATGVRGRATPITSAEVERMPSLRAENRGPQPRRPLAAVVFGTNGMRHDA